jgi:hypothetical protein
MLAGNRATEEPVSVAQRYPSQGAVCSVVCLRGERLLRLAGVTVAWRVFLPHAAEASMKGDAVSRSMPRL